MVESSSPTRLPSRSRGKGIRTSSTLNPIHEVTQRREDWIGLPGYRESRLALCACAPPSFLLDPAPGPGCSQALVRVANRHPSSGGRAPTAVPASHPRPSGIGTPDDAQMGRSSIEGGRSQSVGKECWWWELTNGPVKMLAGLRRGNVRYGISSVWSRRDAISAVEGHWSTAVISLVLHGGSCRCDGILGV